MLALKFVAMTWLFPHRAMGTGLERDIFEGVFTERICDVVLIFSKRTARGYLNNWGRED